MHSARTPSVFAICVATSSIMRYGSPQGAIRTELYGGRSQGHVSLLRGPAATTTTATIIFIPAAVVAVISGGGAMRLGRRGEGGGERMG